MDSTSLSPLTSSFKIDVVSAGGIDLLGEPSDCDEFMSCTLLRKLSDVKEAHTLIEEMPHSRIKFHLHRMTATHLPASTNFSHRFRSTPTRCQPTTRLNNVALSTSAISKMRLPIRIGGHVYVPLAPLTHTSYAARLISSAPILILHPQVGDRTAQERIYRRMTRRDLRVFARTLPPRLKPTGFALDQYNLGNLKPETLSICPGHPNKLLYQAYNETAVVACPDPHS